MNIFKTSQWLSHALIIWQFIKFISWYNFLLYTLNILKACINLITSKVDLAMLNSSMVFACAIERKRFKISGLSFPIQLWDAFNHLSQDCSLWKSHRYTNDSETNNYKLKVWSVFHWNIYKLNTKKSNFIADSKNNWRAHLVDQSGL